MEKPTLELAGMDGNAFMVLGAAVKAARKAKWNKEKIQEFQNEAMSGDYDNLLQTCCKHFHVV